MGSSGCGKTTLLSCIVGTQALDRGSIKVLGGAAGCQKSSIGFMPQSDSLIEEFTIRELIFFFGTVYGLGRRRVKSRFEFLTNLLELPEGDTMIKHCSGGQKRRVSFALCLVHEPRLLILDEPTVGLDPILRYKIWEFFKDITRSGSATVFLTTHYIEEARQANCVSDVPCRKLINVTHSLQVGLLRKGVLIAEDSPLNLLDELEADSLESAFLKLCQNQDLYESLEKPYARIKVATVNEVDCEMQETAGAEKFVTKLSKIKALVKKNFIQMVRQP